MDNNINNYKNMQLIGEGSFGKVYKLDNNKAIKIFQLEDILKALQDRYYINEVNNKIKKAYKKYIKRILIEIENMKICSYNNIYSVKCYDYFQNEKQIGIIMELCDTNLKEILKNRKECFNAKEIYEILYQLNKTFKTMKENRIVHRDIKLENILIKYDKNNILKFICKLADYGISKSLNEFTKCKTYIGTIKIMAPEILKMEELEEEEQQQQQQEKKKNEEEIKKEKEKEKEKKVYDDKCDLWSIGVIIYELLFKRPPYGDNRNAILNSIKYGQKLLKKTGFYQLDNLISCLLIEDPKKRISWDEYFNHPFFNDEIMLTYKTEGKKEIKILGKKFVERHKNICSIIYNNKEYKLTEYFEMKEMKEKLEIKIIGINRINDLSYMFYDCSSLLSLDDISNLNTININDMSYIFNGCSSLKNLHDISNWNTSDVTNMNSMFAHCSSLLSLPDISNWNTSEVTSMNCMFANCSNLISLPDISKWNISKVNNISNIFKECLSLKSIPNIFNFNNNKIINYENAIEPIPIESTKKIINQIENNIYEIYIGNNKYIGYFCKLPFSNNIKKL